MKTYYVLINEKIKGFYYIKIMKGINAKEVEERLRSCGYLVSRAYTLDALKKVRMDGKEKFLTVGNKNLGMWEAIRGVNL